MTILDLLPILLGGRPHYQTTNPIYSSLHTYSPLTVDKLLYTSMYVYQFLPYVMIPPSHFMLDVENPISRLSTN